MDKPVSAADANRNFSRILRTVREGKSYVVTSHGRPVAKIVPVKADDTARRGARAALFSRLHSAPLSKAKRWTREELYERSR